MSCLVAHANTSMPCYSMRTSQNANPNSEITRCSVFRDNSDRTAVTFSPFLVCMRTSQAWKMRRDYIFGLVESQHKRGVSHPFRFNNRVRKCKLFGREPKTHTHTHVRAVQNRYHLAGRYLDVRFNSITLPKMVSVRCFWISKISKFLRFICGPNERKVVYHSIFIFTYIHWWAAFWFLLHHEHDFRLRMFMLTAHWAQFKFRINKYCEIRHRVVHTAHSHAHTGKADQSHCSGNFATRIFGMASSNWLCRIHLKRKESLVSRH